MKPGRQQRGGRLRQNHIKVQQLKNGQYIITLPKMWAEILKVERGSVVTFVPGNNHGIELIKSGGKKR